MKSVHDAVLVGIGSKIGEVLIRHNGNVQARLIDEAGLQECDEGAELLRFVVKQSGRREGKGKDGGERKQAAPALACNKVAECAHSAPVIVLRRVKTRRVQSQYALVTWNSRLVQGERPATNNFAGLIVKA